MLKRVLIVLIALALVGAGAFWLVTMPRPLTAADLPDHQPDLENGRYMFFAGGCASCHATPGGDDPFHLGGGLELKSPFGSFYAPNISPDPEDGIGGWSTLDFVNAMQKGLSPELENYYPSFPYTSYQRMRPQDVIDLKGFLDTLDPVTSSVPDHALPFPFNIRRTLGGWKLLFLDGKQFEPDPDLTDEINRGGYLVTGPGHCAECHTPRDMLGGLERSEWLVGGPNPEGEGRVPGIAAADLDDWSQGDLAYALESGFTPTFDSLGGSMAAVIRNTSQLTAEDRNAIAAYLKSAQAQEALR